MDMPPWSRTLLKMCAAVWIISSVITTIINVSQFSVTVSQVSLSEQVSLVSAVRYRCTRTRRHFESLIEGRIVYHGLQVSGTQSQFPLFAALRIVLRAVLGVVDEVLRRVVLEVVSLSRSWLRYEDTRLRQPRF